MNPLQILQTLEPRFREAGKLAVGMQGSAKQFKKSDTGLAMADIVTEADLKVQEFLLDEIAKTELIDCHLLAEEDTPLVKRFTGKNPYYLSLDPIDGTAIYAKGGAGFSTIVMLHDGKDILYTYNHFPALNWTYKIVGKKFEEFGKKPKLDLPADFKNKILFYSGQPEEVIPELYQEYVGKGLSFSRFGNYQDQYSITEVMVCGKIAGRWQENPNVYDGLASLHYAQSQGYKIYTGGPYEKFNLSNINTRPTGKYYPGYYLVIK